MSSMCFESMWDASCVHACLFVCFSSSIWWRSLGDFNWWKLIDLIVSFVWLTHCFFSCNLSHAFGRNSDACMQVSALNFQHTAPPLAPAHHCHGHAMIGALVWFVACCVAAHFTGTCDAACVRPEFSLTQNRGGNDVCRQKSNGHSTTGATCLTSCQQWIATCKTTRFANWKCRLRVSRSSPYQVLIRTKSCWVKR